MTNTPEGVPELPKPPRLAWQPIFGREGEAYRRTRDKNIADLAVFIDEEVLPLYFPDIAEGNSEMAEALVLRWATGLRIKFEEGIQAGIDMERNKNHFRQDNADSQSDWPSRPNGGWVS
jgi:hypothetical protein